MVAIKKKKIIKDLSVTRSDFLRDDEKTLLTWTF